MINRIKGIFFLLFFLVFIFLIIKYYFSEQNIIFTNKSRSSYTLALENNSIKLPILENDTGNIIVYKNELDDFKKNRKKRFWEKLISDVK